MLDHRAADLLHSVGSATKIAVFDMHSIALLHDGHCIFIEQTHSLKRLVNYGVERERFVVLLDSVDHRRRVDHVEAAAHDQKSEDWEIRLCL